MSHQAQRDYFEFIKTKFPTYFKGKKVLDIGSLDINGCNRPLFAECEYYGLDIGPGKNVDIVSVAHEYDVPNESYDVVLSGNAFEHDMFLPKTITKMVNLLKPGGLMFFSCAGEGHAEHGTVNKSPKDSPLTTKDKSWESYYKNVTEEWVREIISVEEVFSSYKFEYYKPTKDLRFWAIKK